jgi:putative holliday junction resolvase
LRVLGVDFGGKRIGIALGESEGAITTARPPIDASGKLAADAEKIAGIAKREGADAVVVGLPLQEEQEAKLARICEMLAERIRERGVTVFLVNEALTSVEADANLLAAGLKASTRRKLRDGEAARLILERFFDAQGR